jgi:hypothetical protein
MPTHPPGCYIVATINNPGVNLPKGISMAIYQIKVTGNLDQTWVSWFNQMKITTEDNQNEGSITVFTGPVSDQAELRGLLIKIWDLNLELLSVQKMRGLT